MENLSRNRGLMLKVAAGTVLLFAFSAVAQISPGPLSRAHQSLNGTSNCTTCHRLGAGQANFKCLDCHTEIATRLANRKGLHATYHLTPSSGKECVSCHSEHNGENFPIVKWDPKTFDHKQTGYILEGKHAGLACEKCHSSDKVSASERAAIKVKDLNRTFLGISPACVTCHRDEHKGRLGTNCLQCHNYEDWKSIKVEQFDHAKTRYPLTGLHAQVACQKCHTPGPDNKLRYVGIPFALCSDCHADPHHGSFAQGCQVCHNTSGWKKVSSETLSERFDHSKTKYPLLGKHGMVDCIQCHGSGDFKKPLAFERCMDCHKPDPHNGQFAKRPGGAECASCHTVDGWKPSKFTMKDHASSAYPLQGGHARLQCAQCHIPKGRDTLFKIKFQRCTDCHTDQHAGQFAAAPYFNACDRCHNLESYKPSTFTLARHKETHFILTGGHIAVPCSDCHKESAEFKPKPSTIYQWQNLSCTSCHADPHKGQFKERMLQARAGGGPAGCEACHSTKSWRELSSFDHSRTSFPLVGTHRATACIDCHKPQNMSTRLVDADFKAAPTTCEECHQDIHGRQFAKGQNTTCADCHNTSKWKPSLFDHDTRTAFSLQGAHRNVRCEACHKLTRVVDGKTVLFWEGQHNGQEVFFVDPNGGVSATQGGFTATSGPPITAIGNYNNCISTNSCNIGYLGGGPAAGIFVGGQPGGMILLGQNNQLTNMFTLDTNGNVHTGSLIVDGINNTDVHGVEAFAFGTNATGVYGEADAGSNTGVQGYSQLGVGVMGIAGQSGALAAHFAGATGGGFCNIDFAGNFGCTGTKSAVVPLRDGRQVALYAVESPENWFEDFGSGQLKAGTATVLLDSQFAQTVNSNVDYHVFITPNGECSVLYVSGKTATSFEVRESNGGRSDISFDYRIVARRKGYETLRMQDLSEREAAASATARRIEPPHRSASKN